VSEEKVKPLNNEAKVQLPFAIARATFCPKSIKAFQDIVAILSALKSVGFQTTAKVPMDLVQFNFQTLVFSLYP